MFVRSVASGVADSSALYVEEAGFLSLCTDAKPKYEKGMSMSKLLKLSAALAFGLMLGLSLLGGNVFAQSATSTNVSQVSTNGPVWQGYGPTTHAPLFYRSSYGPIRYRSGYRRPPYYRCVKVYRYSYYWYRGRRYRRVIVVCR